MAFETAIQNSKWYSYLLPIFQKEVPGLLSPPLSKAWICSHETFVKMFPAQAWLKVRLTRRVHMLSNRTRCTFTVIHTGLCSVASSQTWRNNCSSVCPGPLNFLPQTPCGIKVDLWTGHRSLHTTMECVCEGGSSSGYCEPERTHQEIWFYGQAKPKRDASKGGCKNRRQTKWLHP